jgi:hypothetical protein
MKPPKKNYISRLINVLRMSLAGLSSSSAYCEAREVGAFIGAQPTDRRPY